jgi:hypothetical protein
MPVTAIASKSRRFDTEHCAGRRSTYCRHQLLEAGSVREPRSGPTEVVIDDGHRRKADRSRRLRQSVLTTLTFGVLDHLPRCRLADVDNRATVQMLSADLRVHRRDLRPVDEPRLVRALREAGPRARRSGRSVCLRAIAFGVRFAAAAPVVDVFVGSSASSDPSTVGERSDDRSALAGGAEGIVNRPDSTL